MNIKLKQKLRLILTFVATFLVFLSLLSYFIKDAVLEIENNRNSVQTSLILLSEFPEFLNPYTHIGNLLRYIKPENDLLTKINKPDPVEKVFLSKNKNNKIRRNELLLLSKYDKELKQSTIEIVDLSNFSTILTIAPDIEKLLKNVRTGNAEIDYYFADRMPERFRILHPYIEPNLDIVFHSQMSPLFKVSICGKLKWINDDNVYHHSLNIDGEGNYWAPTRIFPFEISEKFTGGDIRNFIDDGIAKISSDGEILYKKSINQILIDNNYHSLIFGKGGRSAIDPIHLNDIEVAPKDTQFWKKNDLFLSARDLSTIIVYRPSSNKVLYMISGPLIKQHDVDIISDNTISVFNNNAMLSRMGNVIKDNSEIAIYNFETKQFSKLMNDTLKSINFATASEGLSEILSDNSLLLEEQNKGRILLLNSEGQIEWEYTNEDEGQVSILNWSRVIRNKATIKNLKNFNETTRCQ